MSEALGCPVCRAGLRGSARCPRCGADLTVLMQVMARAWHLRKEAAARLASRELALAATAARASVSMHATRRGRRILCIAGLLRAAAHREAGGAG